MRYQESIVFATLMNTEVSWMFSEVTADSGETAVWDLWTTEHCHQTAAGSVIAVCWGNGYQLLWIKGSKTSLFRVVVFVVQSSY